MRLLACAVLSEGDFGAEFWMCMCYTPALVMYIHIAFFSYVC